LLGRPDLHPYNPHRPPSETCHHFGHSSAPSRAHPQRTISLPHSISQSSIRHWYRPIVSMSDMQYPGVLSAAPKMSSLPKQSSTPASVTKSSHVAMHYNRREVLYHADHRGRYAVQSYEVRPPSRQPTTTQRSNWQHPQPSNHYPVLQSVERASPTESRSASRNPIAIVQSRVSLQVNRPESKGVAAISQKLAAPPPAPRPQRLPSPELSDLDDDEPFCCCDIKKKCEPRGTRLRKKYRRTLF
jgi:hypothetical protein